MKKIYCVLFISFLLILTGCSSSYTIEISGTPGVEFTGSLNGGGNSQTIEGSILTVPRTYQIEGWPAAAVIQNKGDWGTLTVTIKKDGKVLNTQTTTAAYGIATVSSG